MHLVEKGACINRIDQEVGLDIRDAESLFYHKSIWLQEYN